MNNPYINEENANEVANNAAATQPSAVDNAINNAAQNLPFVPENFNAAGFCKRPTLRRHSSLCAN